MQAAQGLQQRKLAEAEADLQSLQEQLHAVEQVGPFWADDTTEGGSPEEVVRRMASVAVEWGHSEVACEGSGRFDVSCVTS